MPGPSYYLAILFPNKMVHLLHQVFIRTVGFSHYYYLLTLTVYSLRYLPLDSCHHHCHHSCHKDRRMSPNEISTVCLIFEGGSVWRGSQNTAQNEQKLWSHKNPIYKYAIASFACLPATNFGLPLDF